MRGNGKENHQSISSLPARAFCSMTLLRRSSISASHLSASHLSASHRYRLAHMELREKRSVISQELKTLEPGSLYITISVPRSDSQLRDPFSASFQYLPYLPHDLDLASYEVSCAEGIDREEFDWGVYLHRGHGNGTWYGLRRLSSSIDASMGTAGMGGASAGDSAGDDAKGGAASRIMPFFGLSRLDVYQSPRLQARVAGLIRVLRVPSPFAAGLTSYLDWLAVQTASSATRSFIWASSMYLRTRRHLSADCPYDAVATDVFFDTKGFLQEALHLAYKEVWYGLAGQLPRPIMASAFGVELVPAAIAATELAVDVRIHENVNGEDDGGRSAADEYHWGSGYQRSASVAGSSDDSSTLVGEETWG
ncbi:hypothetical protein GGI43DRAFT_4421 [Trichoderma evansii]